MGEDLLLQVPAVEPDELAFLRAFTRNLAPDKLELFITIYNGRRKRTETILLCCLLGFIAAAGIQRFVLGQIGMGFYIFSPADFA